MKTLFATREVARILGLNQARIRYWAHLGLVPCQERPRKRPWLPFKGLVALRTIKALREQGVSLHQIRACVEKLKRCRPDLADPLAEVRFSVVHRRLVLTQRRRRFSPEGQLHFDFSGERREPPTLTIASPSEAFLRAMEFEQLGALQEAGELYAAVLAFSSEPPDALLNMGSMLHRCGFIEGAAAHFRQALAADPRHPAAHYHLGNLLEERADFEEAIRHYRQALEENPEFAEACFNLARVLEKTGDATGAKSYWRLYLELDPRGEWAEFLLQRLKDD